MHTSAAVDRATKLVKPNIGALVVYMLIVKVRCSSYLPATNKKHIGNVKYPLAMAADAIDGGHPYIEKHSSLWQTLESMQLLRMVPRKPHFRPFEGTTESLEGQAIGKMVTLVGVAENTCQLRFDSPRSSIEEYLETLVDLERHGFDVERIRKRLTDLLLVKDGQEELEGQSKEAREKMQEVKADAEGIQKEMELLSEKVQALMRKRKKMLSEKEKKEVEIAAFEAKVKEMKKGMVKAHEKFDGMATAAL